MRSFSSCGSSYWALSCLTDCGFSRIVKVSYRFASSPQHSAILQQGAPPMKTGNVPRTFFLLVGLLIGLVVLPSLGVAQLQPTYASALAAATASGGGEVTFAADIAPILQRSCQTCHRPGGVGPMSLLTYEEVAPWAAMMKYKTGLRDRAGVMPPYYLERDIGIQ